MTITIDKLTFLTILLGIGFFLILNLIVSVLNKFPATDKSFDRVIIYSVLATVGLICMYIAFILK